jgi:hypothetical protein
LEGGLLEIKGHILDAFAAGRAVIDISKKTYLIYSRFSEVRRDWG